MPIKFVCQCGKRLRAQSAMAGRRSACPRCGAPVGVPTLQPTARGATLGPMSPAERIRSRFLSRSTNAPLRHPALAAMPAEGPAPACVDPSNNCREPVSPQRPRSPQAAALVSHVMRRRWHPRQMESHWYHCLLYPLRAWPLVLGLAMLLTAFSGGLAHALPTLLLDFRQGPGLLWICLPWLPSLLILGYVTGFLDCTLTCAAAGEVRHIHWPGRDIALALKSGARWFLSFLAGPILPAGAGLLFWIHGGDLLVLDWLILAETMLVAISCWLLLVWAVNDKDRLGNLHPGRMGEFIRRLGRRLVALAIFAAIVGLTHFFLIGIALEKVHGDALVGWSLLFLCWMSGMSFATFLFRWVGVWLYWDRLREKQQCILGQENLVRPAIRNGDGVRES